ncbi:hypothetical protein B0H13DRAFT_1612891 [Mycena leptocephala]|nr:hypothetical protein B0H13DRAFT_1612891 [Mycena leptocephala]
MAFFTALRSDPALQDISFTQMMTLTRVLDVLKNDITLCQPINVSTTDAPLILPPSIISFVSAAMDIPVDIVPKCWAVLKDEVWSLPHPELSATEEELFRLFGWKFGISKYI